MSRTSKSCCVAGWSAGHAVLMARREKVEVRRGSGWCERALDGKPWSTAISVNPSHTSTGHDACPRMCENAKRVGECMSKERDLAPQTLDAATSDQMEKGRGGGYGLRSCLYRRTIPCAVPMPLKYNQSCLRRGVCDGESNRVHLHHPPRLERLDLREEDCSSALRHGLRWTKHFHCISVRPTTRPHAVVRGEGCLGRSPGRESAAGGRKEEGIRDM